MRASILFPAILMIGIGALAKGAMPAAKMQGLSACHAMIDDHARLACYDIEAPKLIAAVDAHDVVMLSRKDMQDSRRGLFGFSIPKLPLFGSNGSDSPHDDVAEIDGVVKSAAALGYGKWQMRMDDGAIWDTTEAVAWDPPRAGSKVHIKRGAFGSFFIRIDGAPNIRALRTG